MGGIVYGLTSPIVGHPLDTVKTKMIADKAYHNATFRETVLGTYRLEGLRGFYRGFVPPLVGSMIYRGAGLVPTVGHIRRARNFPLLRDIPLTGGLKPYLHSPERP